jgi:hypothetical protein
MKSRNAWYSGMLSYGIRTAAAAAAKAAKAAATPNT